MYKYRKKPVEIEAFQITDALTLQDAPRWFWDAVERDEIRILEMDGGYDGCEIQTLEGKMTAKKDDYIIRGVNGEIYPCKPDIFKKTYEKID